MWSYCSTFTKYANSDKNTVTTEKFLAPSFKHEPRNANKQQIFKVYIWKSQQT